MGVAVASGVAWEAAGAPAVRAASAAQGVKGAEQVYPGRCIIGHPCGGAAVDPARASRRGGVIPGLARAEFAERGRPSGRQDAARLAVPADMLEEAGASDPQLVRHLRRS
jgi:hypothetical protein